MKTIQYVNPRNVYTRENFNPRIKPYTEDIKPSILTQGVRDAVEVVENKDGTYTLNAQGHRRLLALIELLNEGHAKDATGRDLTLPVVVVPDISGTDEGRDKLLTDILTLNTGKPLEFLEIAEVIGKLFAGIQKTFTVDGKASANPAWVEKVKSIASTTGYSVNAINNYLAVLDATPVIKELINNNNASASLALDLFLSGDAKGDWAKVQGKLVKAVADAAASGKSKATKKDVVTEGKASEAATPAEKTPEELQKAAEKAEADAEAKRAKTTQARVDKFASIILQAGKETPKVSPEDPGFQYSVYEELATLASYFAPHLVGEGEGYLVGVETAADATDVGKIAKRIANAHFKEVKALNDKAKDEAKALAKEVKENAKALEAQIAELKKELEKATSAKTKNK
jgi:hypothetical protein